MQACLQEDFDTHIIKCKTVKIFFGTLCKLVTMLEIEFYRMRGYYIMQINPVKQLRGEVSVPGDKSISHRSIMFGALAKELLGSTHFLHGADCLSTIGCFRAMGNQYRAHT